MELLPNGVREKLPGLYSQEQLGADAVVHVKYFTPDSNWTWHATKFDGVDTFFGLVDGFEKELGCFSLSELKAGRGPLGLPIERDMYWNPRALREIAPEISRVVSWATSQTSKLRATQVRQTLVLM